MDRVKNESGISSDANTTKPSTDAETAVSRPRPAVIGLALVASRGVAECPVSVRDSFETDPVVGESATDKGSQV